MAAATPGPESKRPVPADADAMAQEVLGREGRRMRIVDPPVLLEAIELAVREAFLHHWGTADPDLAAGVGREARLRFGALLRRHARPGRGFSSGEFLRAVQLARDEVITSQSRYRAELAELERELEGRRAAAAAEISALDREAEQQADPRRSPLAQKLRELFAAAGAAGPEMEALRERVIQVALAAMQSERRRAIELQRRDHEREIDALQRRVAKLVQSLARTEETLRRLAGMKSIDPGLASIYREVQGLSEDEANIELKRQMLLRIFEANLKLQEEIQSLKRQPPV